MDEKDEINQQLLSAEWYKDEAIKVLAEYRNCRTLHEQAKMRPRLEEMLGKLHFEARELEKYLPDENF